MLSSYKVIFFDAGGTLLHPYPSVGEIYRRVAASHGRECNAQQIEDLFRKEWLKRDGLGSLVSHSSEKIERQWWRSIVHDVFIQIGGVDNFDAFFDELYDTFASPDCWRIYPDSLKVLEHLASTEKTLGVISNWDSRLLGLLEKLDIRKYFKTVLISAVFGASKPSSKIFEEALRLENVQPHEAVHIGDSLEDDIKGAMGVGMQAILIDRHETPREPLQDDYQNVTMIRELTAVL